MEIRCRKSKSSIEQKTKKRPKAGVFFYSHFASWPGIRYPKRVSVPGRVTHFQAVRMLAATTVFWGLSFPVVKSIGLIQESLLPGINSWFHAGLTGFVRFFAACLILTVLCWKTVNRMTRMEAWQGLGLGFFSAGGILFQMDGLSYTSASTSAFLTQSFCVLVPIFVAIRDKRRPQWPLVIAIIMVMTGVAVLSRFDWGRFHLGRGEWETLVAAVFFAGQILWLERPIFAGSNANHFSIIMFLTMALISVPIVAFTMRTPSDPFLCYANSGVLVLSAALIVFCTLAAFVLMNQWQPFVPATEASIIYGAEPVIASLLSLFLPGLISSFTGIAYQNEIVTWELVLGGTLIIGANLFLQLIWMRQRGRVPDAQ
jgi:drug/metabolite transporter (DMT)-like permease